MKKIDRSTMTVIRFAIPLCLSFLIVVGVVLVAVLHPSLGWFSETENLMVGGMSVVTSTDDCDLLIERGIEYDSKKGPNPPLSNLPLYPGIVGLKTFFSGTGFDLVAVSTDTSPSLAFELVNELVRPEFDEDVNGSVNTRYLMPGAYGTLSFYIRPFDGVDRVAKTFTISLAGYTAIESEGDYEIQPVTSQSTLDLLKGHILFFTGRTEVNDAYRYSGLIRESFVYDTAEHEVYDAENNLYKVTIYWEWPETYLDISRKTSTELVTDKYPVELTEYVSGNPEFFFAINQTSEEERERSEGYDDGDQKIGNQVHFVSVTVQVN